MKRSAASHQKLQAADPIDLRRIPQPGDISNCRALSPGRVAFSHNTENHAFPSLIIQQENIVRGAPSHLLSSLSSELTLTFLDISLTDITIHGTGCHLSEAELSCHHPLCATNFSSLTTRPAFGSYAMTYIAISHHRQNTGE